MGFMREDRVLLLILTLSTIGVVVYLHMAGKADTSILQWVMQLGTGFAGALIALMTGNKDSKQQTKTPDGTVVTSQVKES